MILIGDLHNIYGNVDEYILKFIKKYNIINENFYQVGDFGVIRDLEIHISQRLNKINKILKSGNNHLYVIRGNHDDPMYFKGQYNLSNLHLLPDYTVVNIDGYNVLGIGGAVSIDRLDRIKNDKHRNHNELEHKKTYSYFVDEGVYLDEEKLKSLENIDVICTHTKPTFCPPYIFPDFMKDYLDMDSELHNDILYEGYLMDQIFNILKEKNKIKYHFYGHFHNYYNFAHDATHICIDQNTIYELK